MDAIGWFRNLMAVSPHRNAGSAPVGPMETVIAGQGSGCFSALDYVLPPYPASATVWVAQARAVKKAGSSRRTERIEGASW